jgi:hypothetical protein
VCKKMNTPRRSVHTQWVYGLSFCNFCLSSYFSLLFLVLSPTCCGWSYKFYNSGPLKHDLFYCQFPVDVKFRESEVLVCVSVFSFFRFVNCRLSDGCETGSEARLALLVLDG